MKEDDFVGIDELEQEHDSLHSGFFPDIMFEFLDMSEIASGYQKVIIERKRAISEHTRKSHFR